MNWKKLKTYPRVEKTSPFEDLVKLINLNEDFSVSELIDNCLAQNKKKTFIIINENNFNNDDSILIIRTFINKLKRILSLSKQYELTNNIDKTINEAKPSIFWKDKDIVKKQISFWTVKNIESLIVQINEIELKIKKNSSNAINIILDFIIKNCSQTSN